MGFLALAVILILGDLSGKLDMRQPICRTTLLIWNLGLPGFVWLLGNYTELWLLGSGFIVVLLGLYFWARLHIRPFRAEQNASFRLRVMMGGRALVRIGFHALLIDAALLWLFYRLRVPAGVYVASVVCMLIFTLLLFANGTFRMFFTSRRLSIVYRVAILLFWYVPVVNLLVLRKCCRLCFEEYDFALYKASLREIRAESDMCRTKYPLIMVHGILFRDLRYFNYWGRIPKELTRLGATIYYGNQEAVGTVVNNAADIEKKIHEVLEEMGSDKVNIIAHSKGGLDSRYAISKLGAAPYVASLTTMCTPHRGVKFVNTAAKMPEKAYRLLAKIFDGTFRKLGDKQPDFYTATNQFATAYSAQFNEEVTDAPEVYYQSYATKMRSALSDCLLSIPYLFAKAGEGDNDGLVSVESAKWGEFRGVLSAPGRRGISHGDIIDLKREDIKGFDVTETYAQIVKELKEKGF